MLRVLGFGLGFIAGVAFVPLSGIVFAWTTRRLKNALGHVTLLVSTVASVVTTVVAFASVLLPLLPLAVIQDRKTYIAASAWGLLSGVVVERLRERLQARP